LQLLAACGVTAFFTSWTGYVVIANLSALAHQLLGQAKTCVILLAGHVFFHNPLSEPQGFGAAVAMSAMVAYTYFSIESTKPSSASSTPKRNRSELDFGGAHHNGGYGGDGTDLRSAKPEAKPWTRGGGGPRRRGASSAFII